MIGTLAFSALLLQQEGVLTRRLGIPNPDVMVMVRETRLEPAKLSPKEFDGIKWEFEWLTSAYGNVTGTTQRDLRIRVYSQEKKAEGDKGPMVGRMAIQLWSQLFKRYKIDHSLQYNSGIVDFFLCFGGKPGGEQLFGQEILATSFQPVKVNTIYIYQMSSFKDPVEMAREVAHEYGHAVLPAIGGFTGTTSGLERELITASTLGMASVLCFPVERVITAALAPLSLSGREDSPNLEYWGNGYLGEKLFLRWLRDDIARGALAPEDAMGATAPPLDAWIKRFSDPLIVKAATEHPDAGKMMEGQIGLDNWTGLALYVDQLCPPSVFVNALRTTSEKPPRDFPQQVVDAMAVMDRVTLAVPESLRGKKTIWIPLGKGKLSGGTLVRQKGGWAEVAPLMPNIVITNRN